MPTTTGTIKHRHHSVLAPGTADIDVPEWNDSEVVTGGTNGDALVRDSAQADGWGWTPLGIYAPLNSPAFTGVPTVPTAAPGTNTTQAASTAFVTAAAAPPVWAPVTYNAANFVGTGSMVWTVDAGDQTRFAYLVNGKTMTVAFYLDATTLSGTAAIEIRIVIPGGFTSKGWAATGMWVWFGATGVIGILRASAGNNYLSIFKADLTNFTLAANSVIVAGTITFEIN